MAGDRGAHGLARGELADGHDDRGGSGRLEDCEATGRQLDKTASGNVMLRLPPEVHTASAIAAKAAGMSLNQFAALALEQAAAEHMH